MGTHAHLSTSSAGQLKLNYFIFLSSVIHAKVLPNYTVEGDKHKIRVYELKILNIYKGSDLLINRTNDAQVINRTNIDQVNSSSTAFGKTGLLVKAYADAVELEKGTEYLLTGKIRSEKLKLNLGSLVEQWATVTPAYLAGINGFYAQNCECHITPCFGQPCKPLKGCDVSLRLLREFYQGCEWRHSYCVKNALGSACSWHETAEYVDCLQTP